MLRLTAGLTTLALLAGFLVAPLSHVHLGGAPAHHHRESVAWDRGAAGGFKHAHLAAHDYAAHPYADGRAQEDELNEDGEDDRAILRTGDFIFNTFDKEHTYSPFELVRTVEAAPSTGVSVKVRGGQPPAHGPPAGRPTAPRAPPIALPAA